MNDEKTPDLDPTVVEPEDAEVESSETAGELGAEGERPQAGIVPDIPDGDDLEPEHQFVDEDGVAIERTTEGS